MTKEEFIALKKGSLIKCSINCDSELVVNKIYTVFMKEWPIILVQDARGKIFHKMYDKFTVLKYKNKLIEIL